MIKLHEQAQHLADEAKNISDRIAELGGRDAIPIRAIQEDISQLCFKYAGLRTDLEKMK